ncbi:MAG: anti-sigma factor family protein [Pirellulaceae bacterium]
MRCEDAQNLLSAHFDGELPSEVAATVTEHLAECAECRQRVEAMRELSELAAHLPEPAASDTLWDKFATKLDSTAVQTPSIAKRITISFTRRTLGLAAIAVTLLVIVGWLFMGHRHEGHDHQGMAAVFEKFIERFARNPSDAHALMLSTYENRLVDDDEAAQVLKRPLVTPPTLLGDCRVVSRHVLKMPCCACIETVYAQQGKTRLVIFEHESEQATWFGKRPQVRTECAGKPCSLIELPHGLATTWGVNKGCVTVFGAQDLKEVEQLVGEIGQ